MAIVGTDINPRWKGGYSVNVYEAENENEALTTAKEVLNDRYDIEDIWVEDGLYSSYTIRFTIHE